MFRPRRSARQFPRSGSFLVESLIAVTLFSIVLLSSMAMVESGRRFSSATLRITSVEDLAQQMLFRLEHELASATGAEPEFSLPVPFLAAETGVLAVSSTVGFPPRGTLLLDRGTEREERVAYGSIGGLTSFRALVRGQQCSAALEHPGNDGVDQLWCGLAQPLDDQTEPAPGDYDGIALESGAPVYFRGDGTGFSYRLPVDPSGGNNPLNGHELHWGAEIPGAGPSLNGWMALVFEVEDVYEETQSREDVNRDGDTLDAFDVGQIRRLAWDTTDAARFHELGLGPTSVIQERCDWGGDLDGDGFDDPIFLWDPERNLLHVRLFLLGSGSADMPVVRRVESVLFLRNEPEL